MSAACGHAGCRQSPTARVAAQQSHSVDIRLNYCKRQNGKEARVIERNKKIGAVAIAVAIIVALAAVVFSENICYLAGDVPTLKWLLVCLRVNLYEEIPGNEFSDHIYLPTKYILLACATLFAVGILWRNGSLPCSVEEPRGAIIGVERKKRSK